MSHSLLLYSCDSCGTVRAIVQPPASGAVCAVCSTVDSQKRISITTTRKEEGEGTDTEAIVTHEGEGA